MHGFSICACMNHSNLSFYYFKQTTQCAISAFNVLDKLFFFFFLRSIECHFTFFPLADFRHLKTKALGVIPAWYFVRMVKSFPLDSCFKQMIWEYLFIYKLSFGWWDQMGWPVTCHSCAIVWDPIVLQM